MTPPATPSAPTASRPSASRAGPSSSNSATPRSGNRRLAALGIWSQISAVDKQPTRFSTSSGGPPCVQPSAPPQGQRPRNPIHASCRRTEPRGARCSGGGAEIRSWPRSVPRPGGRRCQSPRKETPGAGGWEEENSRARSARAQLQRSQQPYEDAITSRRLRPRGPKGQRGRNARHALQRGSFGSSFFSVSLIFPTEPPRNLAMSGAAFVRDSATSTVSWTKAPFW